MIWGVSERHGPQLGPLAAIMDTPGLITIVIGTRNPEFCSHFQKIASNVAQNLYIYFGADVDIKFDFEVEDGQLYGNVISLGMEDENGYLAQVKSDSHLKAPFPIRTKERSISINDTMSIFSYSGRGVGAIFLHPLPRSRLLLVLSGTDQEGLERAATLFPYRTGVGQPDWIVVGPKMGANGMQGVEAMGYYSNSWDIESGASCMS